MSTFNLDGIQFTADNTSLGIAGKKTLKFGNTNNGDFADVETDGVEKFVNAVEIDWNGMQLGDEHVINTTGELASYISTASTEINNIRTELSSNYITTSAADNKYQPKGPYLTSETDPIFVNSAASSITNEKISNWDTAYNEINNKANRSELDNYQPKGSYLELTGGTIFDTPFGPDDDIYTYTLIEPNVTRLAYGYAVDDGAVIANKMIEMTEGKINVQFSEHYDVSTDLLTDHSCVITPDDVVLKVDNAEVKKLSEACQGGANVTDGDTSRWNDATNNINSHLSDTPKHVSDNERNAWNAKADSSELANYLPLTGGIIAKNTEGGPISQHDTTIGINPNEINLTNYVTSPQKNVNITVDGISIKSSIRGIGGINTGLTSYCTITPNDVIIKSNDEVINGLSYLLEKINDLTDRVKTLEGKTGGGTIIKDPTQQVPSTGHETEVVTP